MRKILIVFVLVFMSISLIACSDRQISDTKFNVVFYVGRNASYVDTYFDVTINTKITAPEEPTKTGFLFMGWYKDISFNEAWDFDTDVVNSSIALYAKWSPAIWQISFAINDLLAEEYVDSSNVITEFDADDHIYLPLVRRPGGSFKGWILVPSDQYTLDMTIYRYTSELPITEYTEFVLYPVFTNNKYMITFTPRMTGIPTPAPKTGVEYGSIVTWVPVIEDTATHTFIGWFTKNGSVSGDWGVQIINGQYWTIPSNALLYGRWQEK